MNKTQQTHKPGSLLRLNGEITIEGHYPVWDEKTKCHNMDGERMLVRLTDVLLCLKVMLINDLPAEDVSRLRHCPHRVVYVCLFKERIFGFYEDEVCLYKVSDETK